MKIEQGGQYWSVESLKDLRDWVIMYEEPWKEEVVRLHCRRPLSWAMDRMEFRQIYCRTDILRPALRVETVQ